MTVIPISTPLMSFECAPCRPPLGQRIAIIGLPGASKTTLARHLSQQLTLPHIAHDALYWGANWTPTPPHAFAK
jgi:SpoVK/Ycf46/Vps4 family AAA+-type ATPase